MYTMWTEFLCPMEHGSYNKTSVKQETKTLYERLKLPIDNKLALSVRA